MRWQKPVLEQIDAWRAKQPDNPSRPEAIRRLVEQALVLGEIDSWCARQEGSVSRREALVQLIERALVEIQKEREPPPTPVDS